MSYKIFCPLDGAHISKAIKCYYVFLFIPSKTMTNNIYNKYLFLILFYTNNIVFTILFISI